MFANNDLNQQINRINNLITKAKTFEPDDELKSHLAKYICVLCSGFIENAVYHVFSDIATRHCPQSIVLTYTKTHLYKLQNTNTLKIKEIAKSFNANWWDNGLKDYLQEDNRGAAIDYILKERHNIAHGRSSEITIDKLDEYLNKTTQVIKYIETNIGVI